jgi:glycosyltransferase 2 family protein
MKDKSRKYKIFRIAMLALTISLLIYFCVWNNNLAVLISSFREIHPLWLLGAAACTVVTWVMDALVIQTLTGQARPNDYHYHSAFRVTMIGQYFNSVTPYAIGGQPAQFVVFLRQGIPSGIAISTLVQKFLVYQTTITLFSLAVIIIRSAFFLSKIQGFFALAVIGFLYQSASVLLLLLFTYSPKFTTKIISAVVTLLTKVHIVKKPDETREKVKGQLQFYLDNNKAMKGNRQLTVRVYSYTFIQLLALFSVPFFIYKAFCNPGAPVVDMISAQCFVTMISGYTPLPGASGAAEGSFLVLFRLFFSEKILTQAMLLWRFITYYSSILVGAFFVLRTGQDKMEPIDLAKEAPQG